MYTSSVEYVRGVRTCGVCVVYFVCSLATHCDAAARPFYYSGALVKNKTSPLRVEFSWKCVGCNKKHRYFAFPIPESQCIRPIVILLLRVGTGAELISGKSDLSTSCCGGFIFLASSSAAALITVMKLAPLSAAELLSFFSMGYLAARHCCFVIWNRRKRHTLDAKCSKLTAD
jgi:hypothetical protein